MEPFVPQKLPIKKLKLDSFIRLIGPANQCLKENSLLTKNHAEMIKLLAYRDAVLSSKIEHYTATMEEVIAYDNGYHLRPEHADEIAEVVNHYRALEYGIERVIDGKELTLDLICDLNSILLSSPESQGKNPGCIRKVQNWIGVPGTPIEEAFFVPPVADALTNLMQNFEEYLTYDEVDPTVLAAIAHAQFQIVHPFEDGNGRVCRMLIPLMLYRRQASVMPTFFMSEVLLSNIGQYYGLLTWIVNKKDWESWIKFFLLAIKYQQNCLSQYLTSMLTLRSSIQKKIQYFLPAKETEKLVSRLFDQPVFDKTLLSEWIDSNQLTENLSKDFLKAKIFNRFFDDELDEEILSFTALFNLIDPIRRVANNSQSRKKA